MTTRREFYLMRLCDMLETRECTRKPQVTIVTQTRDIRCRCNKPECQKCRSFQVS